MDSNNMNNQNYQQQNYQQNYQQPYQGQTYQQPPVYNNYYQTPQIPDEYKPISPLGYLGYDLLFCLPFIGFIIVIIMAFAPANKNVKNFARSFILAFLIAVIAVIILVAIFGTAVFSFVYNL